MIAVNIQLIKKTQGFAGEPLSEKYGKSVSTMQRMLKGMRHKYVISKHKEVVILIDTTYWGRSFGLMVIKDALRNKILWHRYVQNKTISDYLEGIAWLRAYEFKIYGIVCDGLRGLCKALFQYKVQMCQVH